MDNQSRLKEIKQQFFAFRNGMLADTLRTLYPYKIIFGLNVPQLAEIYRNIGTDASLASLLWEEKHVRESRLLACYLFDVQSMDEETVMKLIADVQTQEEADMLSFRLLKHLPFAKEILDKTASADCEPERLVARSLARHLD